MIRPKITPFLWFDGKAEEAARFYASVFPDSAVTGITPGPDGAALVVAFQLAGVPFLRSTAGRNTRSPRRFHSSSTAKPRPMSTTTGTP